MTPEQFGPYLLLKKLSEDRFGETFRAGRSEGGSARRLLLLRVLNGSALEGHELWPALSQRTGIQPLLKSPNIARGSDLGSIQGVPYVAYEYISGRTLDTIVAEAASKNHPLPSDHALLIAERLALALAVAYQNRLENERILHGFLVPNLVTLSYEGETKLMGFELGPALLELSSENAVLSAQFGRYLSPEASSGQASNDIYSLGVILLELLLGRPLPTPDATHYADLIDHIRAQGSVAIADLLSESIAPASQRVSDIVTWHKMLSRVLVEGQHKSTTFNLAFFMHSLFRDEIELEAAEIEAESRVELESTRTNPPVAPTEALIGTPSSPAEIELLPSVSDQYPALPARDFKSPVPLRGARTKKRASHGQTLALGAALMILGATAFWAWDKYLQGDGQPPTAQELTRPDEVAAPKINTGEPGLDTVALPTFTDATTAAPEGEGSTADMEARLNELVEQRTRSMERALRREYDSEIARLSGQLEEQRRQQAEMQRTAEESRQADTPPVLSRQRPGIPTVANPSTSQPATAGDGSDSFSAAGSGLSIEAAEESEERRQDQAPPAPSPQATEPAATSAQSEVVQEGQLVKPGPGVLAPTLASPLETGYPLVARRLRREGTVEIRVLVSHEGRALETQIERKTGYGFDESAEKAIRRAEFNPATKNGVPVSMWTRLRVNFRLNE